MKIELKKEQYDAIYNHDGENLLVSASAGSGKTFVMITRMIRLITSGKLDVENMLAVTFTEKAAAEMKERLSAAILKKLEQGDCDAVKLKDELLSLQVADICTIDAFCSRLVKRYFFSLGINRDFSIIEDSLKERLTEEALKNVLDKYYVSKDEKFLRFIDRFSEKRTDKPIRDLIVRLHYAAENEPDPKTYLSRTAFYYTDEGFRRLSADLLAYIKADFDCSIAELLSSKEKLYEAGLSDYADYVDDAVNDIKEFSDEDDYFDFYGKEFAFPKIPTVRTEEGSDKDAVKEYFKKVKDGAAKRIKKSLSAVPERERAKKELSETKDDYEILSNLVLEFSEEFLKLKKEENAFDFCDIERFAYELLKTPEILSAVKSKYTNIFVDEYQDVNALQEEMFTLLSNDNAFTVGDVKQSIYGFRGCDPEFFSLKREKMFKLGQVIDLNHNFRSAEGVLSGVNKIFDASMREDNCGIDYKNTSRLVFGGTYPGGDGSAVLHIVNVPAKVKKPASEVYDIVADYYEDVKTDDDYTALEIKRIVESELKNKIFDPEIKDYRDVRLSDIAVLCRKKVGSTVAITKSLAENGIKVVSEIETSVCDFKEVKLLISLLNLADCFYQDAPLSVCMISGIGGFTVSDISEIRSRGAAIIREREKAENGETNTDKIKPITFSDCFVAVMNSGKEDDKELSGRLKEFYDYIDNFRFIADFKGIRFAVNEVIREKGLNLAALTGGLGGEKLNKVERFLRESVAGGRELTIKEFLYKIKNSPDSFTSAETAGGDAITVMTSHKSKGLEFPVVIVVHAESKFNSADLRNTVLTEKKYGVGLKRYDDETRTCYDTVLRTAMKYAIKKRTAQEEARLFYVATTRAKNSLHIIAIEKERYTLGAAVTDVRRPLDFIPDGFETEIVDGETLISAKKNETKNVLIGKKDEAVCSLIERNLKFAYPHLSEVMLPFKTSVTANLKGDDTDNRSVVEDETFTEPTDIAAVMDKKEENLRLNGLSTPEEGIIAHKILEHYDFKNNKDLTAEIGRQKAEGVLTEDEFEKINTERLKKTLSLPIFDELKDYELYREQYFVTSVPAKDVFGDTCSTEPVLLQGVIDLLAIKDGKAVIVDYKYSLKGEENLIKTYKKQLSLYKEAVERSLKVKVERTVIISLLYSKAIDCPT